MSPVFPPHFGASLTPTHHTHPQSSPSPLPTPFIAVITGAGKGLGHAISLAYAHASCTGLALASRTASDLDALEAAIRAVDSRIEVEKVVCDVRSEESVGELERKVRRRWGRVDVVVANAGVISGYVDGTGREGGGEGVQSNLPIGIVEDGDWARVLDVNLMGTWRVARAFMPLLGESKGGAQTLICSSSLASHSSTSAMTPIAYNISKLACNRLIEHIANDHGKDGVQAFALHPGAVLTPQTQHHAGEVWGTLLSDDVGLAGAMCVWLSREKRSWLSGRYVSANWDVDELEGMKDKIGEGDMLKFRMVV